MLHVYHSTYKSRWVPCEYKRRLQNVKRYDVVIPNEIWAETFKYVKMEELFALNCVNKIFNALLSGDIPWKNVIDSFYWHNKFLCDERKMVGQWKMASKMLVYGLVVHARKRCYVVAGGARMSTIRSLSNRRRYNDRVMWMLIKPWKSECVNYKIEYQEITTLDNGFSCKIKVTSDATDEKIQFKDEDMPLVELLMRLACVSPYKIKIL
jgi:hypothetical protein